MVIKVKNQRECFFVKNIIIEIVLHNYLIFKKDFIYYFANFVALHEICACFSRIIKSFFYPEILGKTIVYLNNQYLGREWSAQQFLNYFVRSSGGKSFSL